MAAELRALRQRTKELTEERERVENELIYEAQQLPNWTCEGSRTLREPRILDATSDAVGDRWGRASAPDEGLDHVRVADEAGLVDMAAGARVSGSKFAFLRREAALVEQALVCWALQRAHAAGFVATATPDVAHSAVAGGCGFQSRRTGGGGETYDVPRLDGQLVATAEIALAGSFANCRVDRAALPSRLAASSHCFRAEALSDRGLFRLHQFSKVELFAVCDGPDQAAATLDEIVALQRSLFDDLGLDYVVLDMPPHDLGAPARRKIDVEAWMPGRGSFGEISSASDCGDYQARRLNIRLVSPDARARDFAHTINGTALAVPRVLIALLERPRDSLGRIPPPSVLRPFLPPDFDNIAPIRPQDPNHPSPMLGTFYRLS